MTDSADNFPSENSERRFIFLIILVATVLRFFTAATHSLSNDELSALSRAKHDSVSELISQGVIIDYHPAGIELFIYFWIKYFGDDPFSYRFPFILAGILSVFLIYILGRRWFSENTGMLTAATFAVFHFTLMYTIYARPYSPGLLFCLLTAYSWTRIIFPSEDELKKGKFTAWWLLFIVSMTACMHIHYFTFVFAAGVGMTGLFFINRKRIFPYLLSGIIALLLFIPEWKIFLAQMKTGDIGGWLGAPGSWYFFKFFYAVFNSSWWMIIILLMCFISGFFVLIANGKWSRFHAISLAWFFFSYFLAYGYSILRHPVIQYSTLIFVLPFLLFVFFSACSALTGSSRQMKWIPVVFLLLGVVSTFADKKLTSRPAYGVFKEIASDIKSWSSEYSNDSLSVIINVIDKEYINYYFRKLNVHPNVITYRAETPADLGYLTSVLDTISKSHLAFAWSNTLQLFEVNKLIQQKFPKLLDKNIYFNSGAYLYSKGNGNDNEKINQVNFDYENDPTLHKNLERTEEKSHSGKFSECMDSLKEYSFTLSGPLKGIDDKSRRWITAKAWFWTVDTNIDANLVMQFEHNGKTYDYSAQAINPFSLHPGRWQQVIISRVTPEDYISSDSVKVYFWNRNGKLIYVDDLSFELDPWENPYLE